MLQTMKKSLITAILMASTGSAMAADSIDVHVIGTVTPAACTPTISGGGTADYGTIKADTLSKTDYTTLSVLQLDMSINCDAPAKVALTMVNNRPGTVVSGGAESAQAVARAPVKLLGFNGTADGAGGMPVVGLGLQGSNKIGGYALAMVTDSIMADGASISLLGSNDGGTTWSDESSTSGTYTSLYLVGNANIKSFGVEDGIAPIAFTTMTSKLAVQAYLNKISALDMSKPIQMDGLTTIQLTYL